MTESIIKKPWRKKVETLAVRFIKFNIIGFSVFLVATLVFVVLFPHLGGWTWLVANGFGGILQFILISYFNKKRKGLIFEQVHLTTEESQNHGEFANQQHAL